MALISRNTDLKSLRYGKDRVGGGNSNQPYIKSPIPENRNQLDRSGGIDFLLRGGTLTPSRAAEDVSRLTKMFSDFKSPNGALFVAKQNILSLTNVKTQASGIINQGIYTPASTILQAGGNAFGIHLNKQGLNPFQNTSPDDRPGFLGVQSPLRLPLYAQIVKSNQEKKDNRLVQLANWKLKINVDPATPSTGPNINELAQANLTSPFAGTSPIIFQNPTLSSTTFEQIKRSPLISSQDGEILQYAGGPNSILGIGKTTIKRPIDNYTNAGLDFTKNPTFKGKYYVLSSTQISNIPTSKDNTQVTDFRKNLLPQQNEPTPGLKKNILSASPDYTTKNIENRVNLGDPGKRSKDVSSYVKGTGDKLTRDLINAHPLYQSNIANHGGDRNDLVKFSIGIINNDDPNLRTYIHFRAFLDSMDDQYNAEWNGFKYMGRGENFYRYNGFTRTINLSWTVAAQSKEELIPMYQKLNFLASSLTPNYSADGYMRGNLAVITVGGYLFDQPGIINSINYSVPTESPWEIGINNKSGNTPGDEYGYDTAVKELPHIIRVTGFSFTPIHKFVPKLQKNIYGNTYTNKDGTPLSYYIDPKTQKPAPTVSEWGVERYIALATGTAVGAGTTVNNYDSPQ
jgi:hypothetical protein